MTKLAALLFIMAGISAAHAQRFSVNVGYAMPQSDFAKTSTVLTDYSTISPNEKGGRFGAASNGFNVELEVSKELNQNMDFYSGIGLMYNGISEAIDSVVANHYGNGIYLYEGLSMTVPVYFNIPWISGIRYSCPLSNSVSLFADAGFGVNMRVITKYSLDYTYVGTTGNTTWDYSKRLTFARRVSVGATLHDHYSVRASYCKFGKAKVISSVTQQLGGMSDRFDHESDEMDTRLFTISLGYTF